MKRALVISGGGSKGAFAGGVVEYLIKIEKRNYDLLLGSSTGSLIIPHISIGEIDKVKNIYTNVNDNSIFSLNPFRKKIKNDKKIISINFLNTIYQFIKKKKTFGESLNLKKTIQKNLTIDDYHKIKKLGKEIVVTVSNLSKNKIEYKSSFDYEYKEFIDWIWISCNLVPFMSLINKNGDDYADGGYSSMIPIHEAIKRGASEIDIIILDGENNNSRKTLGKNPFSLMLNLYGFLSDQVKRHDIIEGKLAAKNSNTKLNFFYTPKKLTENCLSFDKEEMTLWWKQGFEYAKFKTNLDK